ncbi:hypothetical protein ZWY2020_042285 [Hordeum vulgare]|nr:hypothetical protein ZWY2020_042285 [Hordeum vulgare]
MAADPLSRISLPFPSPSPLAPLYKAPPPPHPVPHLAAPALAPRRLPRTSPEHGRSRSSLPLPRSPGARHRLAFVTRGAGGTPPPPGPLPSRPDSPEPPPPSTTTSLLAGVEPSQPPIPPTRAPTSNFPPELTELIQQKNTLMQLIIQNENNNNNHHPPQAENLTRFLRLNPPTFSSSIEPIVADDWLRQMEQELITAGCTEAEKVRFVTRST